MGYFFTHPSPKDILYEVSVSNGRQAFAPDPSNPDTLTPRTDYVNALQTAYQKISAAYPLQTAQGIAVMEAGVVLQVTITNPGYGYTTPPTVTISSPGNGGMTAQGIASIANGVVTGVTMTNQGSGYDFGPQVSFSPPSGS